MISMAAFDLIIDQICKGLLGFTSVQFQRELLVFNPLIIIMNITVTKMMGCKMMQNRWKVIKSNKYGGKSNNANRRGCEQVSIVQVCVLATLWQSVTHIKVILCWRSDEIDDMMWPLWQQKRADTSVLVFRLAVLLFASGHASTDFLHFAVKIDIKDGWIDAL